MIPEQNEIDRIERYLSGRMDQQDRLSFQAELLENPDMQEEVVAYRTLLEGFAGLRTGYFAQQIPAWSKEWAESDAEETELIEAYLTGELAESLKDKVEKRIIKEPVFKAKVDQYRTLVGGLNLLPTDNFSEKLTAWNTQSEPDKTQIKPLSTVNIGHRETKVRTLRTVWTRLAAAAAILLLIGFGAHWYAGANYSNPALIAYFYQQPNLGNTMGGPEEINQLDQQFQEAHQLLQAGKYEEAKEAFVSLQRLLPDLPLDPLTRTYYQQNIAWNKVLARLGTGEDTEYLQKSLEIIAENPDHEYQQKAQDLLNKLESFWRKI